MLTKKSILFLPLGRLDHVFTILGLKRCVEDTVEFKKN